MIDKQSLFQKLTDRLEKELPQSTAWSEFAPVETRRILPSQDILENAKQSAVLLLLYPKVNETYCVLIKRPSYDGTHSAQVSFPGGKLEDQDTSYYHTACRECEEEIGIKQASLKKIGSLSPIYIPPSKFLVHPFVASIDNEPSFILQESEVDYVIEFPISKLLDKSIHLKTEMQLSYSTKLNKIPYLNLNNEIVWGATAMILNEFAFCLRDIRKG